MAITQAQSLVILLCFCVRTRFASPLARPFQLATSTTIPRPPQTIPADHDGTLASLFGSEADRDAFFRNHFGTSVVHLRRCDAELRSPLHDVGMGDIFEATKHATLRRNGECYPVDKSTMTYPMFQEFIQGGGSSVIPVVEDVNFQPLRKSLETSFESSVSMTIYHSGPDGVALHPHTDSYDVFVLQLAGEKNWEIVQGYGETRVSTALTLVPGDLLYIPRNVIHSAQTASGFEYTTHLTIGLLSKWKVQNTLAYADSINNQ